LSAERDIRADTLLIPRILYLRYFGDHKQNDWFHLDCIFESLAKARATTKKITSSEDLQGFDQLSEADQDFILKKIKQFNSGTQKYKLSKRYFLLNIFLTRKF
jgi:hypothetical protein